MTSLYVQCIYSLQLCIHTSTATNRLQHLIISSRTSPVTLRDLFLFSAEHLIIASAPKNLTVIEGSPFRLECRFSSDPPPSITWYYVSNNGLRQVVTSGVTGDNGLSILDKDKARVGDAGKYICEGTNGIETETYEEQLTVLCECHQS